MDSIKKKIITLIFRYIIILFFGLFNIWIFYKLFTSPTIFLVSKIISIFGNTTLFGNIIFYQGIIFQIIPACVAGSAYYLLFILIMSISDLKPIKHALILVFSFSLLFIINVLRIVVLVFMFGSFYFEPIHLFFWYVLSTLFVFLIWVLCIKVFSIKEIPIYSDIKFLMNNLKVRKSEPKRKHTKKTKRDK